MNDQEFRAYIDEASAWLQQRQQALQAEYQIANYQPDGYDQALGTLRFKNAEGNILAFEYIPIGSWAKPNETFMWGWGNQTVEPERRAESERIKALAEKTGYDIFHKPVFKCDEEMAWDMVALSAHELNAIGVYRVPHEELRIFFALMNSVEMS